MFVYKFIAHINIIIMLNKPQVYFPKEHNNLGDSGGTGTSNCSYLSPPPNIALSTTGSFRFLTSTFNKKN